jgi:hypothetical protein
LQKNHVGITNQDMAEAQIEIVERWGWLPEDNLVSMSSW